MFVVPTVRPETTPVEEPMVATAVLLLVHAPKAVASFNVVVPPIHPVFGPVIADGFGLTVNGAVATQPVVEV